MNDEIGRRLREAAETHQPDHDRILARVQRGVTATTVRHRAPKPARSWPKVVLAGSAAAGILAVAGLAVAGVVPVAPARPEATTTLAVPTTGVTPSTSTTPAARPTGGSALPPASGHPDRPTTGRSSPAGATPAAPVGSRVSDGPLSAQGSVDPHSTVYWAQSTLALDTTQPLSALTVEVRITQTGSVQSTGQWQTGPADDFTTTAQESDGVVVYRWELKPGRTAPAAQHVFAVQYNHTAGTRDAGADGYDVQATSADGVHTVQGRFTRAK
ncbi:hypothetical protein AMES_8366 [Amycolatopsis mediterranei S699]|uniref:Uncharacterized protein n=2 Tax=Amycolatopsis mediterranei TaxID=33910 RepID=A0A0H3DHL8_AMYMU|nr:hypothetical protein [Amycolatopsis mediterranei]ADJ50191.1 conserved hypothetical protein [Amycolatopsis mediterranei U32]AEK47188.1 hypothetical protein RAM_43605 [Amycolatopsis mediterranei S699]AFO81899.1 hypothetical protein AMES_8366 [Amycolatopsis mediterranei S699]AGT89028.1 hypothetical protein B737_8367 [Amycolatopsis mediterranei RB]KDO07560.1 hypothetical protein DV26_25050 [Amycolatopsis mediterranei]